jgi:hypothetical protein
MIRILFGGTKKVKFWIIFLIKSVMYVSPTMEKSYEREVKVSLRRGLS